MLAEQQLSVNESTATEAESREQFMNDSANTTISVTGRITNSKFSERPTDPQRSKRGQRALHRHRTAQRVESLAVLAFRRQQTRPCRLLGDPEPLCRQAEGRLPLRAFLSVPAGALGAPPAAAADLRPAPHPTGPQGGRDDGVTFLGDFSAERALFWKLDHLSGASGAASGASGVGGASAFFGGNSVLWASGSIAWSSGGGAHIALGVGFR